MFSLEYLRRTSLLNGKEKLMGNISSTISNIDKMSFIVVDRDGKEYKHFNKKDYDVKILDLVHPQKSNRYNPFAHIHNDADVLSMINSLFTFNINEIKPNSVFDMAERKLLTAFCFYVLDKYKEQPDNSYFFHQKYINMNSVWTKSQKEILYKYKSYRQHFTNSELLESEGY